MPDQLQTIVQRMIDANEPEENIASVIKEYSSRTTQTAQKVDENEPGTYWGGVARSLKPGGSVDQTIIPSLKGYAKGAIVDLADIPSSLWNTAKSIGEITSDPIKYAPDAWKSIKGLPQQFLDTTRKAGSEPEAFGRMMGQLTGQPLATEGLIKGATSVPSVVKGTGRALGAPIRAASGPVEKLGTTALAASPYAPYGWKLKTAGAGYGLRRIGQAMKEVGIPAEEANAAAVSEFRGGNDLPKPPTEIKINTKSDPFSRTPTSEAPVVESDTDALRKFYGGDKPPLVPSSGEIEINRGSDPFSRTPFNESDAEALKQFYGGDKPQSIPSSGEVRINEGSDPFSRASLPKSLTATMGKVVGKAPTLEESLTNVLKEPPVEKPTKTTLAPQPGADMTQSPGVYKTEEGTSGYTTGNPSTPAPPPPDPIIEHSPSNPGMLRGSLDGGKTWRYSTDHGETWSMNEPKPTPPKAKVKKGKK